MEQIAISLKDVSVTYGDKRALTNASLDIPYHSFTGVIGMNGAGKSTIFKVIMGLVRPQSGTVTVCDDPVHISQKHGHVAYVPQSEDVDWDFPISVYEVVMMGRFGKQNAFKMPSAEDHEHVIKALEHAKMLDHKDHQIGELSGGQKKRVFVGRALAQGANILLLDEPFAGLDATSEKSLIALFIKLKEEGKTVILATHDLLSLPDTCDRVALVKNTVIANGPIKEVFTKDLITQTFDGLLHHISFN